MGADFLERTMKTIKRSWDRQRVELATSDLLTRQPDCAGRSVVGELVGDARVTPGERLTVEKDGAGLVARRGLTEVARITDAPAEVLQGVADSCGVGVGTVDQIHEPFRIVEITVC